MLKRYFAAAEVLIGLLGLPHDVKAQSYFESRLAQIKKEADALPASTTGSLLLLGDSITEGFSKHDVLPKDLDRLLVVNQGIGGDDIGSSVSKTGVASRLDQVKQVKPKVIFLMIGVNNLWDTKKTPEEAVRLYEELLPRLQAAVPDAKLVIQTILPTRDSTAYVNSKVTRANLRIRELAREKGLQLLDLHTLMEDDRGELKAEYSSDGVHLTKQAYELWLQKIKEIVSVR